MNLENKSANIVGAALCAILCVRFSASYFSYALGIFILFLLYHLWTHRKCTPLKIPRSEARGWILGILLLYGACFVSSALLGNRPGMRESGELAVLSLPFFMMYFLRAHYPIDAGFGAGLSLGASVLCLGGFFLSDGLLDGRMQSFFPHPNGFGSVLMLLIPFAGYYSLLTKNAIGKILMTALCAVMLYCLWRTGSRGAMVSLIAGIGLSFLVMAIVQRKVIGKKKLAALALAACLVFAAGAGLFYEIQSTRTARSARGGERIEMLEASYAMWQDHKFLGVGMTNWEKNYYSERYHPENGIEKDLYMPHNMPAYFFSTAGLLGGSGYLAFLALTFLSFYRAAGRAKDKWLAAAAFAVLLAFHINGLVDETIINKLTTRLFYGLMGYSLAAMLSETDQEKRIPQ